MKRYYCSLTSQVNVSTRPKYFSDAIINGLHSQTKRILTPFQKLHKIVYLLLLSVILGQNCSTINAISHDVNLQSETLSTTPTRRHKDRSLRTSTNRQLIRPQVDEYSHAENNQSREEKSRRKAYDEGGVKANDLIKEMSIPSKINHGGSSETSITLHHRRVESINSYELVTQFDGETGTFGMMFDIEAKSVPVYLDSIDIHTSGLEIIDNANGAPCDVLVYTREGSHISYESNQEEWELLIDSQIECRSFGQRTIIPPDLFVWPDGSKIRLDRESSRAFYISIKDNPVIRYSKGTLVGSVHVQDDFIVVKEGSGMGGFFDSMRMYQPRLFNGVVNYSVQNDNTHDMVSNKPDLNTGFVIPPENIPENFTLRDNGCPTATITGFDDNLGSYGAMFDVIARKGEIFLYGMDLYTDLTEEVFYSIYTKRGRFFENDGLRTIYAWTKLGSGSFVGAGSGKGSPVPNFAPIEIPHGVEQGFYVTLTTADIRYRNETADSGEMLNVGEPYIQDEYFEIQSGVGVGDYPLSGDTEFFSSRLFLGSFHYKILEECSSDFPSVTPTAAPPNQTLAPTAAPLIQTRAPTSECITHSFIVSRMDGPDYSNGVMFDLRALDDLTINTLEIKGDFNCESEDPILYVFTKYGTYDVDKEKQSAWSKLCETSFSKISQGPNGGMLIPLEDFITIRMDKYEIRSFYIFSPSLSISYSSGSTVGSTVIEDDYLHLMEGSSVFGDAPFGTNSHFEPRIFNGVIHYHLDIDCPTPQPTRLPTSMPSANPTPNPTVDPYLETTIEYNFNLEHALSIVPNKVFSEVSDSVEKTIRGYLQNVDLFVLWERKYELELVSVDSKFGQQEKSNVQCNPTDQFNICTMVETSVKMRHLKTHDSGILTYHLLKKSEEINANLGLGSFISKYVGDQSLETTQVITLKGVPPSEMGESETEYFQKVSKNYLEQMLTQDNVDILSVGVSNQKVVPTSSIMNGSVRRLVTSSSLEITTVVTGKHRPPPDIDFSALVSDAVNEDSGELVEELQKPQFINDNEDVVEISYFKHVESVTSRIQVSDGPSSSPTIGMSYSKAKGSPVSASIKAVIMAFGITGGVLVVLFVIYWTWKKKKNKEVLFYSYDYFTKDDLQGKGGKRSRSNKNGSSQKIYRFSEAYDNDDSGESVLKGTMRGRIKAYNDYKLSQDHNKSNSTCTTDVSDNEMSNGSLNYDGHSSFGSRRETVNETIQEQNIYDPRVSELSNASLHFDGHSSFGSTRSNSSQRKRHGDQSRSERSKVSDEQRHLTKPHNSMNSSVSSMRSSHASGSSMRSSHTSGSSMRSSHAPGSSMRSSKASRRPSTSSRSSGSVRSRYVEENVRSSESVSSYRKVDPDNDFEPDSRQRCPDP